MAGWTYTEQLQSIANSYRDAGEPWPATSRQIADWAIRRKLWWPHRATLIKVFAEQLSRAMREEYFVDPQGRNVRAKHAARITHEGKQLMLWDDIRSAPPQHMEMAFQLRRQQIVGDCRQLKTDVDSFNENAKPAKPIQLVLDFTQDVAELEALEKLGV